MHLIETPKRPTQLAGQHCQLGHAEASGLIHAGERNQSPSCAPLVPFSRTRIGNDKRLTQFPLNDSAVSVLSQDQILFSLS
jgi:hypothetical protein